LSVPVPERPFFRDRAALRVAFSFDALARDPDAEIAVLGSPFLGQLLEAIRARAARFALGLIAPTATRASDPAGVELTIPVRDGTATPGPTRLAVHPVGRLIARVVLRAGAGVEEAVVESDVYDLSTGAKLADDLVGLFQDLEAGRVAPADPSAAGAATPVPAREPGDLVRLLLGHLQSKSAERVAARRAAAERELATELGRLDRYFASILKEQSDPDEIGTVTALADRRRTEEVRRSQVKAVVHPLQLIEAAVLVQRAEWQLESARGRRASVSAQRPLSGRAAWIVACPHCGRPPAALVVCRHEHCGCEACCSSRCSVCAEDFCADHGIAECRVDGLPACEEHVRVCPSCRLEHCTAHAGVCAEDEHSACATCLAPCGSCGRDVCNRHAQQSHADAPRGSRRLCAACLRHCEGGTNEPVGMDEVVPCVTCGKLACSLHGAECLEDKRRHCNTHLRPLLDTSGAYGCATHRKECHVDGQAYSLAGAERCPVCGKDACARHRAVCAHCGRHVCTADLGGEPRRCSTCAQLVAVAEPPAEVVRAARAATGGGPRSARAWRMARDETHVVVELDLGWSRKAVFTLRPGEAVPESVVRHSLVGSKRRK
jgi:hypothetical protein